VAPARAFWKGHLKLSLVTCPIALYTGTSATERVSFRQKRKMLQATRETMDRTIGPAVEAAHRRVGGPGGGL
jgi:DNA end-binding protein Ku